MPSNSPARGTSERTKDYRVRTGDIPSQTFIQGCIDLCYSAYQVHPVLQGRERIRVDSITGQIKTERASQTIYPLGMPDPDKLKLGPSLAFLNRFRRVAQKSWKDIDKFRTNETPELAARMRMVALSIALATGTGIRIGELLALRVSDVLPISSTWAALELGRGQERQLQLTRYRGKLTISKSASQASDGHIVISLPKYGKVRTCWIPGTLYSRNESPANLRKSRRTQVVEAGLERFKPQPDGNMTSLWDMTRTEALHLWAAGIVPLGWLLLWRLQDMWDDFTEMRGESADMHEVVRDFQKLLLFPTKGRPRKNQRLEIPRRWTEVTDIVEGAGGYQPSNNFAKRYTSPVFDSVSEHLGDFPESRRNSPNRQGWYLHSLRNAFVSQNIYHGVPLPTVSKLAGHATIDFTLQRYARVLEQDFEEFGFE